jgi:hypothetical protein
MLLPQTKVAELCPFPTSIRSGISEPIAMAV